MVEISILLPVFNEAENLTPLLDEIFNTMRSFGRSFEVIAVDDGSTDESLGLLEARARDELRLKVVSFRKNAGQTAAFDAGFRHATGRIIVTLDSDRQNDPNDIPRMVQKIDEGYDFVAGRRAGRKDALVVRKVPSWIANWIIRQVTKTKIRDLGCSLKAYRREITDDLFLYGEMHRFIGVLVEGLGARVAEVDVNHRARAAGKSKYGLSRTFKVLLDLLTVWYLRGFQTKPIYVFGGAGLSLVLTGFAISSYVLYEKYFLGIFVHRNPLFIIAVICAVIGVQFFGLGLIAEVMARTYFESRGKPAYHVRKRINLRDSR